MVSVSDHSFHMLSRHMGNENENDFALFPEANMYSQQFSYHGMPSFHIEHDASYAYPRTQDLYPTSTGFDSTTMYSEIPQNFIGSPELRGAAPSNYSTASGPSATSSTIGSPNSNNGHIVSVSDWGSGLGINPSIVNYDNFGQGTDYNFSAGMEDFTVDFNTAKPGFVGECENISRSTPRQCSSITSSHLDPFSSSSPIHTIHTPMNPSRAIASPITPVSAIRKSSREECLKSPRVSALSVSPVSCRSSSSFNAPCFPSPTSASRSQGVRLSPVTTSMAQTFTSEPTYSYASYQQSPFFSQSSGNSVAPLESSYPSILHAPFSATRPSSVLGQAELSPYQAPMYPTSPSPSQLSSRSPGPAKADSASPYLSSQYYPYPPPMVRRPSLTISHQSYGSQDGKFGGEEIKEKGRCTWPECGKVFKDLKAHMLTHQNERPEKCPIQTCDYHVKGFARKYDKNRHTLTHYKGTMVCGFCPGSGSAAEKSFNRADVFKRHLTSVHAVEQTPPNSRKKTSANINSGKKLSGYAPDATGKCSTCSATFSNAQDFYEHLDDCVLRIVQQEEPSEAINARRLAEVEQDHDVHETLRNNALPVTTNFYPTAEDDDEEVDDENDDDYSIRARISRKGRQNRNPPNGVHKSRGMTHSKGGVTLNTKGRKKRKDYPSSWGCPTSQMKMKKRVLTVFDGPRRLWKDDMMLDTDYEVRIKLGDEKVYVTDLDVQTMRRAEAFHNATEEEKGLWIADDLTGMDLEKLMEVKREI
ncbi:putative Metallothionein expression activator [Sclerotinia borealis F-4128]|uniref:Putative Metallothionein expression activator n=1 Tax=Sclerotinia borealis (strain F-4128) TaxID=1432307 RepID=W9CGK2_SCLBF|nr:putative Metallothionein expression activator [Sclerotinia borealis F-4128]